MSLALQGHNIFNFHGTIVTNMSLSEGLHQSLSGARLTHYGGLRIIRRLAILSEWDTEIPAFSQGGESMRGGGLILFAVLLAGCKSITPIEPPPHPA